MATITAGVHVHVAGGSGGITPPAGDIGGTTAAPHVVGFEGQALSGPGTAINQVYLYNGTQWVPTVVGASAVSSVSNSDATLIISPTSGNVVASRAALTGDITAALGSNATVLQNTSNVQAVILANALAGFTSFPAADTTTPIALTAGQLRTANTGAGVYTLPAVISAGQVFAVQRGTSTGAITITANTGQTINGGAAAGSVSMASSGASAQQGSIWLLATSTTTYRIVAVVGTDAGLGATFGNNVVVNGFLDITSRLVTHFSTTAIAYSTLTTDFWVRCTSGTFTVTLTTSGVAGAQLLMVTNEGTGTITLTPATGTTDLTTLPPLSGCVMMFDGVNWHTVGAYGLAGGEDVNTVGAAGAAQTIPSPFVAQVNDYTLTANCTFTLPAAVNGGYFMVRVRSGAGGFTGTFTGAKWPGGVAPVITATAARLDILAFQSDGTDWFGIVSGQNYTP